MCERVIVQHGKTSKPTLCHVFWYSYGAVDETFALVDNMPGQLIARYGPWKKRSIKIRMINVEFVSLIWNRSEKQSCSKYENVKSENTTMKVYFHSKTYHEESTAQPSFYLRLQIKISVASNSVLTFCIVSSCCFSDSLLSCPAIL